MEQKSQTQTHYPSSSVEIVAYCLPESSPSTMPEAAAAPRPRQTGMEALCDKVRGIRPPTDSLSSICRVPIGMRRADKNHVYEPVVVTIGPFHHKTENLALQPMQDLKVVCLRNMVIRCHSFSGVEEYLSGIWRHMQDLEARARGCYSETFSICSEDFVTMMILDGCFIIYLFCSYLLRGDAGFQSVEEILKLNSEWMLWEVVMDLLKLENQLPWLVLQQLYDFFYPSRDVTLTDLAIDFLSVCLAQFGRMIPHPVARPEFPHLLALEQHLLAPAIHNDCFAIHIGRRIWREKCSLPSINDLLLSGIVLRSKGKGDVITNIDYNAKRAKLEMPTLIVNSTTVVLLRNLVAYEQCNIKVEPMVTSYVTFMDALVNSPEDVEALRIRGIVDHFLSSNEEVSQLINNLTGGIDYDLNEGSYATISSQIQRHYDNKWSKQKVRCKRLMNTHEGITYLVTIVALYLTALQTIFTVLSYYPPRN